MLTRRIAEIEKCKLGYHSLFKQKKMKKFLFRLTSLIAAVAVTLPFAACSCGGNDPKNEEKTEDNKMRYIDKTGCKSAFERGNSKEITSLGKLTKKACQIAKENGLGLLKTR